MHRRFPLAFKFTLPLLAVLILLGVALNVELTRQIQRTLIGQASNFVVDFVQLQATRHDVHARDFQFPLSTQSTQRFTILAEEVKTKDIVRVKAWNTDKLVLYSDDKSIVGKQFTNNEELASTLETGTPSIEISHPSKQENSSENKYNSLLEIYIPIFDNSSSKPVGVIETYYKLNGLFHSLDAARQQIMLTIVAALALLGIILLALLYVLVLKPMQLLGRMTRGIARGKFEKTLSHHGNDEIGDLFKSFDSMSRGLEKLQELRNEFVFVAAHELRAPVSVIKGYLAMRKDRVVTEKAALEEILLANSRLEHLVNDLLEIAHSDSGKLKIDLQPVDVGEAISKSIKSFTGVAKERNMKLFADVPEETVMVQADARKLDEVLANLISNAIKYGSEDGYVAVKVISGSTEVVIVIEDNGPGIPDASQRQMFHKFYRAPEAQTSSVTGTGLGLYITKELVNRMKGRIVFTSKIGEGTTFRVALLKTKNTSR